MISVTIDEYNFTITSVTSTYANLPCKIVHAECGSAIIHEGDGERVYHIILGIGVDEIEILVAVAEVAVPKVFTRSARAIRPITDDHINNLLKGTIAKEEGYVVYFEVATGAPLTLCRVFGTEQEAIEWIDKQPKADVLAGKYTIDRSCEE